jgi:serine/threonine protein kinase
MRLFVRRYTNNLYNYLNQLNELEFPLTFKEVISIALDIVVGLDFLHRNKIIHRDLKTDNVFVTLDGMGKLQCCSIGDMDSAKRLLEGVKATTVCSFLLFLFILFLFLFFFFFFFFFFS